jgi:hypothetical protein
MLAELVDTVVGVDTHRDTHEVEIAFPSGAPPLACLARPNTSTRKTSWPGSLAGELSTPGVIGW